MEKRNSSGWTVETLLELMNERDTRYNQRFEGQEKAVAVAIEGAKGASTKAENAMEKRFDNTNEWRAAMNDRDLKLLPRLEYDRAHIDLEKRLEEYKKNVDDRLTRITETQNRSEAKGEITTPIIQEMLDEVKSLRDVGQEKEGKDKGLAGAGGIILWGGWIVTILIGIYTFMRPAAPVTTAPVQPPIIIMPNGATTGATPSPPPVLVPGAKP